MLWRKSWLETRLMVLVFMGTALFFIALPSMEARWVSAMLEGAPTWSEDSRRLLPLLSSRQGNVWLYWFKFVLLFIWPMYAVAQGATLAVASCPWMAGGLRAAGLFTFSLPVSRRRVLLTHAALVAVEMMLVALAPSLLFPIVSYITGGDVPFGATVIYALLLSLGGMVFPSFSILLTAVFNNQQPTINREQLTATRPFPATNRDEEMRGRGVMAVSQQTTINREQLRGTRPFSASPLYKINYNQ